MAGPCTPLGTRTPALSLCKPADNEIGWTASLNGDLDTLDGLFATGPVLKAVNGGLGLNPTGQPNGVAPVWNGTAFAMTAIPALSAVAAAGTVIALGTGMNYTTTSATFVDVDPTNLKATVTIPAGASFLVVVGFFTMPPGTFADGLNRVQILAAGQAVAPGAWIDNGAITGGYFTIFGVAPAPAAGAQTIALQYRGDGVNTATIFNQSDEGLLAGAAITRARLLYVVFN